MGKKNVADSSKRERRSNKDVAVDSLQDALNKVFKSYNAEDYLTVIVDALKDTSANISKKTYAEMSLEELFKEKKNLQEEVNAIDKQIAIAASRVTDKAVVTAKVEKKAKDTTKVAKKEEEEVKDAVKEETTKEEKK